jgi:hypothetical protein
MINPTTSDWGQLLSELNSLVLKSFKLRRHITPEIALASWCGLPPASEDELSRTEQRLGVSLPPSYRSFLSQTNGWRFFGSFIERLLSIEEVDWLRVARPDDLKMILECYQEDDIPDAEYLDYDTDKHLVAMRHRYYPDCLLIGTPWIGEGEMILLNSKIVFTNGEWEAIFFANWLPGNQRYRSFRELVERKIVRADI